MDLFSKSGGLQFPKKHHRCISLESGETLSKKSYPKTTNLDMPRFFPRRYSTPELAMRKHALKHHDGGDVINVHPISNKSCQTDILGLDKYLQRPRPQGEAAASRQTSAAVALQQQRTAYKKSSSKKPKVRSVGVHCERRRLTFAAFKGCQKFKHVYKRKISLPQPRSRSPAIIASDDSGRRDSGVLPKLWPDRVAAEAEKPVAAAKAAGPSVKLPRIPMTKDAKLEPDRTDDGAGGGTRLARLTRPQSTGSGSSADTADRKLAYFRASSAPKIDSRYNTTLRFITSSTPAPAAQPTERELQSTTPGSSDTADTTLDMSYVVQHQPDYSADDNDVVLDGETEAVVEATATVATTGAMSSCTTRTVSTSTCSTFAAEPIFPIVFSCESVLRHPLDAGGYVSHTESHRFSVHYVPVEESQAATNDDDDDGSRSSSLVFTSSGRPCQNNEQRLTGDSISITPSTTPMSSNTMGERRLVIERMNNEVQFRNVVTSEVPNETPSDENDSQRRSMAVEEPRSEEDRRFSTAVVDDNRTDVKTPENIPEQNIEDFVTVQNENSVPVRNYMSANKIIDHFDDGGEGDEATKLTPHAHCTDMPLQQSDNEQNYERLTQNHQNTFDSDRTVSNQSPKFDGTETQIERQSVLKPDTHATAADELDLQLHSSSEPKNDDIDSHRDDEPGQQQIDNNNHYSTEVLEVNGRHPDDEPGQQRIDNNSRCSSTEVLEFIGHRPDEKPAEEADVNTEVMASRQCRKQHGGETNARKPGTENSDHATAGENNCKPTIHLANGHRSSEHNGCGDKLDVPNRFHGNISNGKRTADDGRDGKGDAARNSYHTRHSDNNSMINRESTDRDGYVLDDVTADRHAPPNHTAGAAQNVPNHQHYGLFAGKRSNDLLLADAGEPDDANNVADRRKYDTNWYGTMDAMEPRVDSHHIRADKDADTNACHRCTCKNNETDALAESRNYDYRNLYGGSRGKHPQQYHPVSKRRLESVDETAESTKQSNYIGGFLFGDAFYNRKQPQKYETDDPYDRRGNNHVYHSNKYEYYDDSKKVNFTSRSNDRYDYYQDYAPNNRHSPRDEDCTVFADVKSPHKSKGRGGVEPDPRYPSTAAAAAAANISSYYSLLQADRQPASCGDDCSKNTDSDESLTDSLEDGCKFEGAAVSYFLALDGQKSAVTFTLKMPDTLENRLNRRHSLLKKHLHVTTTVRKVASTARVRTRHKGCQTLWTEDKGVQVQRGSTATARKPAVDDHKVLETLLAGLERNRVSENQIRVVGGQKMVSEGNQTELQPPSDRQTQTTRDAAAGPETPEKNAVAEAAAGQGLHHKSHTVKKFSSDNALMVGVVRQNKYKGKEALDGAKNDQLLTLSKGWINFYTLRADSADAAEAQELNDNDDEEIKTEDDGQQYTVHVQAIPEPVVLPVLHVPNRNVLQVPKTCSTTKHLPRLVQTETNNNNNTHQQHFSSHLASENGWCVSVDGPNNMHMKVSLLPDKSDVKSSEHFDLNEENKLEARRLALQRKNNYMRKPYRNIKRTQSTPRDMFSADVSRTESALSAESKYIETIDTQLLIHKARRRLSQEWDTRIQNRGVTESVQLVVTGDSVSSRTSQHYATRGHQHCSFRRQSRRI